jgi:hypothetical protein
LLLLLFRAKKKKKDALEAAKYTKRALLRSTADTRV